MVPKRTKTTTGTVINLKQKSAERQKKEEIADAKKEIDRVKRELKREEAAEGRLRRDRDDIARKLRRKKDDGKLRVRGRYHMEMCTFCY